MRAMGVAVRGAIFPRFTHPTVVARHSPCVMNDPRYFVGWVKRAPVYLFQDARVRAQPITGVRAQPVTRVRAQPIITTKTPITSNVDSPQN